MEPAKTPNAPETKVHFLDYWRIIRIRKTVILAVFLLVVLTTTAVTFILPESFSSTVRIEVGKDSTDIAPLLLGVQSQAAYDPYFIQTEFEKIKSKSVLHEVIKKTTIRDPSGGPARSLSEVWAQRHGIVGGLKTSEVFEILQKQIDVRQYRNTSLIEITVYSEDPNEAALIAQEIAEVYRSTRLNKKDFASDAAIKKLEEQRDQQLEKVKKAQEAADDLREQFQVSDIDAGGLSMTIEPETVRRMQMERTTADVQHVQYETMLNELKVKSKAQLRQTLPTATQDPLLIKLLEDLNRAENSFAMLANELGKTHPDYVNQSNLVANLNAQIDARVEGIMSGLSLQASQQKARAESLKKMLDEAKDTDLKKTREYRPYFLAKREVDTQQRIWETINLRVLQETVDASIPKTSMVDIVDAAEPNPRPVRPNIPLNLALGVVVGLLMGFGLAFFIEYLDTSVKTIDDVERALQAPVLGVIPQNVGPVIEEGPESPHAEAYRVLRTNVLFSRKETNANTLTVVSGGAGEGKSTTIFNLATVFAQNGDKVLIVDSDLRRPSLHKLLNVTNSIGLTNYLLKQNTLEEVIQTTSLPTLHFLPSGKLPSSSLGILNSAQMKDFIQKVKQRYDFVFFDSPPIMGVSDASILASEVDMALLVIQYRKYPQVMTIRAKQMVEKVGGNLLGVVLNNINISQDSYYYYYSGYYYDYYSKHEDDGGAAKNGEGKAPTPTSDRAGLDLKKKY